MDKYTVINTLRTGSMANQDDWVNIKRVTQLKMNPKKAKKSKIMHISVQQWLKCLVSHATKCTNNKYPIINRSMIVFLF